MFNVGIVVKIMVLRVALKYELMAYETPPAFEMQTSHVSAREFYSLIWFCNLWIYRMHTHSVFCAIPRLYLSLPTDGHILLYYSVV